jgi:hypothetical protein
MRAAVFAAPPELMNRTVRSGYSDCAAALPAIATKSIAAAATEIGFITFYLLRTQACCIRLRPDNQVHFIAWTLPPCRQDTCQYFAAQ